MENQLYRLPHPTTHSAEEISHIKGLISAEQEVIDSIDVEIEGLMQQIRRLRFKKLKHKELIHLYQGSITLARRIPHEILATIYEICAQDGYTLTPLHVSHVCSEWRKATQIPTVWSNLYINLDSRDPYGRAAFWAQKSKTTPLHITIDIHNDISMLPAVVDLLLDHSSRWETLKVNSRRLSAGNYILERCNSSSLPLLRALEIVILEEFDTQGNGTQVEEDVELTDLTFSLAPLLHTFTISRNVMTQMTLPLAVTNLSIELPTYAIPATLSIRVMLDVLEQLPSLQGLSISMPYGIDRQFALDVNDQMSIDLPHLRGLTLTGGTDIFGLLPYLRATSLLQLHLRSSVDSLGYPSESFERNVVQFISLARPPLELLELRDVDLSQSVFITCFSQLPHLKTLRLHESDISDVCLSALHGSGAYCPQLMSLDLRWCGHVSGRALVRLVRDRSTDGSLHRITSVTLINCAFVGEQDIIDLARITLCRLMMHDVEDYCRASGCCQNERYRRRLQLRHGLEVVDSRKERRLLF
ncbi:hypothetical protein Moror_17520 [Moniliophthora roreri MCA 2997]|uniref:F-box domain-containing protein n=1 Tax=Moniliophthora roreri (strain MCA 2997) TaxID=1381753 RepID=V2XER2_MONRO|nr:hypothetical protein Moror_17520 [Moniliophthora roreri MCA 2997]